jgi:hypothetical protein
MQWQAVNAAKAINWIRACARMTASSSPRY